MGYFYYPQIFVIPVKAGIQSIVRSMSYGGLGSGLRRNDGFFEVPHGTEVGNGRSHRAADIQRPPLGQVNPARTILSTLTI